MLLNKKYVRVFIVVICGVKCFWNTFDSVSDTQLRKAESCKLPMFGFDKHLSPPNVILNCKFWKFFINEFLRQ